MSEAHHLAASPSSPLRSNAFSRDGLIRVAVGLALALLVCGVIFAGTIYLALVVAAVAPAAAREWHRMVGEGHYGAGLVVTTLAIWLALAALVYRPQGFVPEIVLLGGVLLQLASGLVWRRNLLWRAGGVLYLGLPALAIVSLREVPANGAWLTMALFIVVWATDTGALVAGKLIGGPKIAPILSPNKTWAGTIGGVVTASAMLAIYIGVLGGGVAGAVLFGAVLAVVAHLGDLFESLVKRRFHAKDSGGLIPGHGGVLDRVDSTLSAALALEIAVFVFHIDPLFGARP
jgi:phosphatidate cytidylyltransferase